jgi:hypothetical protein
LKKRIETIRYLAAREEQKRSIVNGTASEYLFAVELVNDALEFVRHVERGAIGSSLTTGQRAQLAVLKVALEAVDTDLPNDMLVYKDKAWADVREAAQRFLEYYDSTDDSSAG